MPISRKIIKASKFILLLILLGLYSFQLKSDGEKISITGTWSLNTSVIYYKNNEPLYNDSASGGIVIFFRDSFRLEIEGDTLSGGWLYRSNSIVLYDLNDSIYFKILDQNPNEQKWQSTELLAHNGIHTMDIIFYLNRRKD